MPLGCLPEDETRKRRGREGFLWVRGGSYLDISLFCQVVSVDVNVALKTQRCRPCHLIWFVHPPSLLAVTLRAFINRINVPLGASCLHVWTLLTKPKLSEMCLAQGHFIRWMVAKSEASTQALSPVLIIGRRYRQGGGVEVWLPCLEITFWC